MRAAWTIPLNDLSSERSSNIYPLAMTNGDDQPFRRLGEFALTREL
jgi:hypothetical protein